MDDSFPDVCSPAAHLCCDCAETCPADCNGGMCFNGACKCKEGFCGADCKHRCCPNDCSHHGPAHRLARAEFANASQATVAWTAATRVSKRLLGAWCLQASTGRDARGASRMGSRVRVRRGVHRFRLLAARLPHGLLWPRGYCYNGTCHCYPGYKGGFCQLASCLNDCSYHGVCGENGRCQCRLGWDGIDCSVGRCATPCCRSRVSQPCVAAVCRSRCHTATVGAVDLSQPSSQP